MADHEISVTVKDSQQAGGCNGCSKHTNKDGAIPHRVHQIDLRSCSFRLCDDCLHTLTFKLQSRLTDVLRSMKF
jgi:hypothetical protein